MCMCVCVCVCVGGGGGGGGGTNQGATEWKVISWYHGSMGNDTR